MVWPDLLSDGDTLAAAAPCRLQFGLTQCHDCFPVVEERVTKCGFKYSKLLHLRTWIVALSPFPHSVGFVYKGGNECYILWIQLID
jgi:hypothetical protein